MLKEDPEFVVCMDEKPYQLLGEVSDSWAMRPGDNKKVDSEYIRHTTYSIFAFLEPLGGRHHTKVREHRKAANWAEEIKYMVDEMSLSWEDHSCHLQLNTHKSLSLYKAFKPEKERRVIEKLEIYYTPKHGSWLDIAEITNRT